MAPSSRFALSLKPSVAYLVLNFCRALEEADDLAVLGVRGHPVPGSRREGRRAGFDERHGAARPWRDPASGISAIFASTSLSPSALPPARAAFSSWARSFIAARSSSVKPFFAGFLSAIAKLNATARDSSRSTSSNPGRPSNRAAGRGPEEDQRKARGDHEVRGVRLRAAEDAPAIGRPAVQQGRELRGLAIPGSAGGEDLASDQRDEQLPRSSGRRGESPSGRRRERPGCRRVADGPAGDPARGHLKRLVRPALGLLDRPPPLGIRREERGSGRWSSRKRAISRFVEIVRRRGEAGTVPSRSPTRSERAPPRRRASPDCVEPVSRAATGCRRVTMSTRR